jgi:two-component sensor histidine kinase
VGTSVSLLIPENRPDEEPQILERIRRGERVDHYETSRRRKDGRLIDVSLTISPVKDADGRIVGASKIARDVTAIKRNAAALARHAEEQSALYRFTDRLQRTATVDAACDAALQAICDALHCKRASVLLFDDMGVMRFVGWRGLSDGYRGAVEGHSPWTPDTSDPTPIFVDDIDACDRLDALKSTITGEGIAALSFIPLVSGDKVIGKFMTYYDEPHAFTGAELELALTIARQLSFSIERQRAQAQRDLMVAELSHRVKNTLATVISIARQSFVNAVNADVAQRSFNARIRALAQTHGRLADANWVGVSLRDLLLGELAPYRREDGSNVAITGPQILLNPRRALMLGMAIHELVTNAAKHGAFATRQGTVEISWRVEGDHLRVRWIESGGPKVGAPGRGGFGRLLLERALPADLGGSVEMDFAESGLRCDIVIPMQA